MASLRSQPQHTRILGGSLTMLIGSGVVSAVNFGYNVAVARMLGPAGFGHAAAAVTLLMLLSAVTLAFQMVCAKFVARNDTAGGRAAVYHSLLRRAWFVGMLVGTLLVASAAAVARYLNLPSPELVMILALGVAFYIPLGVKRGGLHPRGVGQVLRRDRAGAFGARRQRRSGRDFGVRDPGLLPSSNPGGTARQAGSGRACLVQRRDAGHCVFRRPGDHQQR
jgi:hypothetical protein